MAATVTIVEKNGAGGTPTNKTADIIRFKNGDDAAVNTGDPMVKPGAGSDYSYEKWLRANVAGTYTEITNIKAYMDGANGWTGVNLWAKAEAAFVQPAHATATAGYTNAFSYTSGSPLDLGAGPFTGTGEKGSHLVMMLEVTSAASGGVLAGETLTLAWDEI
jgi:hypothetical protein